MAVGAGPPAKPLLLLLGTVGRGDRRGGGGRGVQAFQVSCGVVAPAMTITAST